MNASHRACALVLALPLGAPLFWALAGCGSSESTTMDLPSDALKTSEASYEAEIAKQKAAMKGTRGTKGARGTRGAR